MTGGGGTLAPLGYLVLGGGIACLAGYFTVRSLVLAGRLHAKIDTMLYPGGTPSLWGKLGAGLLPLARWGASQKDRVQLAIRLRQAGFFHKNAVEIYVLARLVFLVMAWAACVYIFVAPETLSELVAPLAVLKQMIGIIVAVRLSEWWLNGRIKARILKIREKVPQALELLAICVASGLTIERALERVGEEIEASMPEVAVEFARLSSELRVNENRIAVLERFAHRCGVKELEMMARNLIQTLRYGAPLVDSLKMLSEQSLALQLDEIKERASSVPARISVPLIVFVLFPLVALLVAPPLITLARTLFD